MRGSSTSKQPADLFSSLWEQRRATLLPINRNCILPFFPILLQPSIFPLLRGYPAAYSGELWLGISRTGFCRSQDIWHVPQQKNSQKINKLKYINRLYIFYSIHNSELILMQVNMCYKIFKNVINSILLFGTELWSTKLSSFYVKRRNAFSLDFQIKSSFIVMM